MAVDWCLSPIEEMGWTRLLVPSQIRAGHLRRVWDIVPLSHICVFTFDLPTRGTTVQLFSRLHIRLLKILSEFEGIAPLIQSRLCTRTSIFVILGCMCFLLSDSCGRKILPKGYHLISTGTPDNNVLLQKSMCPKTNVHCYFIFETNVLLRSIRRLEIWRCQDS